MKLTPAEYKQGVLSSEWPRSICVGLERRLHTETNSVCSVRSAIPDSDLFAETWRAAHGHTSLILPPCADVKMVDMSRSDAVVTRRNFHVLAGNKHYADITAFLWRIFLSEWNALTVTAPSRPKKKWVNIVEAAFLSFAHITEWKIAAQLNTFVINFWNSAECPSNGFSVIRYV
jgi:hypothetical protein